MSERRISSISVVVRTFDRRNRLTQVLSALDSQTVDADIEVIVIPDGSTDGTKEYFASGQVPSAVVRVFQQNGSPSAARNAGIARATGDLIVFVDDDVIFEPGTIAAHVEAHRRFGDRSVVIGPVLGPVDQQPSPWVAWEQRRLAEQYQAMQRSDYEPSCRQFTTGNASVRREHLDALGGFETTFRRAEDGELALDMSDIGLEFRFEPSAIGRRYADTSFEAWRDAARRYGSNDVVFGRERGRPSMIDHAVVGLLKRRWPGRTVILAAARWPAFEQTLAAAASGIVLHGSRCTPKSAVAAALSTLFAVEYSRGAIERLGSRTAYIEFVTERPSPTNVVIRAWRRARWEGFRAMVQARRSVLDLATSRAEIRRRSIEVPLPTSHADGERIERLAGELAIEPDDGYVVVGRTNVVDDSVPHSDSARRRSEMQYFNGVPSLLQLLRRPEPVHLAAVATLRHPYDDNYFHVTIDCIGGLALLDAAGMLDDRSIVVGRRLAASPVFQAVVEAELVDPASVIVQDDRWVRCNDVAWARTARHRESLVRTEQFLRSAVPTPSATVGGGTRWYLVRGGGHGRRVRRESILRDALTGLGFEPIDPGRLSWPDQVALFSRATHVVGIHGAAFTNLLYGTHGALDVVEIQSPGGNETMYEEMSAALGFRHRVVTGTNPSEPGNRPEFDVDVEAVVRAIIHA